MKAIQHKVTHQYQLTPTSCSPTATSILLSHFDEDVVPLDMIKLVPGCIDENGDNRGSINQHFATWLISRGYDVDMYTFDCQVIDQSWSKLSKDKLLERLRLRKSGWVVPGIGAEWTEDYTQSYIDYLEAGGTLHIKPYVTAELLYELLKKGPILPVISYSTVYGTGRSHYENDVFTRDDVKGRAVNHSIVVYGYDKDGNFLVADPETEPGMVVIEPDRLIAGISTAQIECDNLLFQITKSTTK